MGEQLAQMIADQMGGSGQLAFMVASFSAENQVAKVEGATDYLKKNYPDIEIVTTLNSDDTNEKAFQNAQTLLTTYPDLKGILGLRGARKRRRPPPPSPRPSRTAMSRKARSPSPASASRPRAASTSRAACCRRY